MRSEPEQPLAQEYHDKPGAYFVPTRQLRKSKGGDVKRAGASARTSEHDRPIFMPTMNLILIGSKMNHVEQNLTSIHPSRSHEIIFMSLEDVSKISAFFDMFYE